MINDQVVAADKTAFRNVNPSQEKIVAVLRNPEVVFLIDKHQFRAEGALKNILLKPVSLSHLLHISLIEIINLPSSFALYLVGDVVWELHLPTIFSQYSAPSISVHEYVK